MKLMLLFFVLLGAWLIVYMRRVRREAEAIEGPGRAAEETDILSRHFLKKRGSSDTGAGVETASFADGDSD